MTRNRRLLTLLAAVSLAVVIGWVVVIGAVYAIGGVATVQVRDGQSGSGFNLPVPAVLLDVAVASTGWIGPAAHHGLDAHWHGDIAQMAGALRELLEALEDCPDATLVEVLDRRTSVRVEKTGSALRIEVVEPEGSLTVSVPLRTVRRSVGRLLS